MLNSLLHYSTKYKNDNFKGSKIITGSWMPIVLGALKDAGVREVI